MKKRGQSITAVLMVCALVCTSLVFAGAAENKGPHFHQLRSEIVCSGGVKERILYDDDGNVIDPTADLSAKQTNKDLVVGLASSYDSRTYGRITSVKNQGSANTCWSFAAISAIEASYITHGLGTADSVDFSEDHTIWFTYARDSVLGDGVASFGENTALNGAYNDGGYWDSAAYTLVNWWGAEQDARAPYDPTNMNNNGHLQESMRKDSYAHLQGVQRLAWTHEDVLRNMNEIKTAVINNGACAIIYSYASAHQNGSAYYHDRIGAGEGGHYVTIVGWDDNYPKTNFRSGTGAVPANDGAWLVKNSAGVRHGDQGYDWISYYDVSTQEAVAYDVESASNYDHMYGYNGYRPNPIQMDETTKCTYGNAFVSPAQEELKAVGIWTLQDDITYTIDIYRNLKEDVADPTTGQLVSSCHTTGRALRHGYYTVPLSASVTLNANERYAVVVSIRANSHSFLLIPFEFNSYLEPFMYEDYPLRVEYTSEYGESFYYWDETAGEEEWLDAHVQGMNNALVNAYTKNVAPVDGFIYTVSGGEATIIGYTGSAATLNIPSSINGCTVTAIGEKAFYCNTNIKSVTIPDTVSAIGDHAFGWCTGLETVSLPSSVKTIGMFAFGKCTSLKSIVIPSGVKTIGQQCFDGCSALQTVTFDSREQTLHVESFAFLNCPALKTITIETSNIEIGGCAFGYTHDSSGYGSTGLTICGKINSPAYTYYLGNSDTVKWKTLQGDLQSIAVTKNPNKTTYNVGETLDTAGMIVHAYYSDGDHKDVTGWTCTPTLLTSTDVRSITVTYTEGGKTCTASFPVTVVAPKTTITIHNYVANRTVDYRSTIKFTADVTNPVPEAKKYWVVNGEEIGAGEIYTRSNVTENFTVQVRYKLGSAILAESKVETVKVSNSFFAKLIAFFRSLFGRLPTITQSYLGFREHA